MRDFFVSYTGSNEQWAEWIAWCLEAAGYTVFLQKWDFLPGTNFVLNMDQAVKEARRTLAVFSREYLDARFPRAEWTAAMAADPTGERRSLIPIRIEDFEVDGLLKPVVYIDLVGGDETDAKKRLLDGVGDGRAKPASSPRFPGGQTCLPLQPTFPGQELALLKDSFAVIELCPSGVPLEVLADIEQISRDDSTSRLREAVAQKTLQLDGDLVSAGPVDAKHIQPTPEALSRALDALLRYYAKYKHEAKGRSQLRNLVSIARLCEPLHVGPLVRVFNAVEKGLKGLGDKRLVHEIAEISIHACQRQPRGTQEVEWEAQAIVCGVSWAFQRLGQLEDARSAAEKSLHLGEQIGYDRNSAFCHKCIGRLYRIMAEADKAQRKAYLGKSIDHLEDAIRRFSAMPPPDFGPDSQETGDCYSLLGRSFLVARRMHEADDAVRKAIALIHDQDSKDFSDVSILAGDLQAAKQQHESALGFFNTAINLGRTDDAERSEILGRALLARAHSLAALGRKKAAGKDLERAEEIWKSLGEPEGLAQARWEAIKLTASLPEDDMQVLERHPVRIRVIAYNRHQERLHKLPKTRGFRTAASQQYWDQLLKEAEQQVAIEGCGC
jgi:tetratricopeptide (TPR) repeat protein